MPRSPRRRRSPAGDAGRVPTWEEIARDEGDFLYTVAYRLTGDRDDAQDLVQEVLVRVQRGLRTYQPGSLRGWLARITTNAFLDDARRRTRRPTASLPENADLVLPPAPSAEAAHESLGLSDQLQAALAGLDPDFRIPVVLCDVVGLSYAEIAAELDIPVGTVRSRLHRGRAALREVLT